LCFFLLSLTLTIILEPKFLTLKSQQHEGRQSNFETIMKEFAG